MAYGDSYFELLASGSTGASDNSSHLLFGNYEGLSDLNNEDVVNIMVDASANDVRVGLSASISNDTGVPIYTSLSGFDLPPMRAGTASQLHFANRILGSDGTVTWNVWRRIS